MALKTVEAKKKTLHTIKKKWLERQDVGRNYDEHGQRRRIPLNRAIFL